MTQTQPTPERTPVCAIGPTSTSASLATTWLKPQRTQRARVREAANGSRGRAFIASRPRSECKNQERRAFLWTRRPDGRFDVEFYHAATPEAPLGMSKVGPRNPA